MTDLTKKQEEIFDYMVRYQEVMDNMPCYRAIAVVFDFQTNAAYSHVEALIKKGWIEKVTAEESNGTQLRFTKEYRTLTNQQ